MVNKKWLLCFLLAVSVVKVIECRGRSHGRSHGSHSHGHGSHSSHGGGWFSGWGKSRTSSHSYPASNGYSGHGSGGSHSYPPSNGYSGHGSGGSHTYPASHGQSGYGSGSRYWGATRHTPSVPTYYTSPQHVYVTQYRNSDSQYSDLLTGLTMYNLGRSHGHYHHHYYRDEYYRSSTNHRDTEESPNEEATCFLRIKRNNQEDVLKIPCAIVSTFGSGATEVEDLASNKTSNNCSSVINTTNTTNTTLDNKLQSATLETKSTNASFDSKLTNKTLDSNLTNAILDNHNETSLNASKNVNETSSHSTVVCNETVTVEDPLAVKGAPVDVKDMECSVEIRARIAGQEKVKVTRNHVDCKALLEQARMPVPENKKSDILPSRQDLKAMLHNPPWWFSLFFVL